MGKIRIITVAIHQTPGTMPIEDMTPEEVIDLGAIVDDQTFEHAPAPAEPENGGEEE